MVSPLIAQVEERICSLGLKATIQVGVQITGGAVAIFWRKEVASLFVVVAISVVNATAAALARVMTVIQIQIVPASAPFHLLCSHLENEPALRVLSQRVNGRGNHTVVFQFSGPSFFFLQFLARFSTAPSPSLLCPIEVTHMVEHKTHYIRSH